MTNRLFHSKAQTIQNHSFKLKKLVKILQASYFEPAVPITTAENKDNITPHICVAPTIKDCIIKHMTKFKNDITHAFNNKALFDSDGEYIAVSINGNMLEDDALFKKLCEYYDVTEIESIHAAEFTKRGEIGICIVYKEFPF